MTLLNSHLLTYEYIHYSCLKVEIKYLHNYITYYMHFIYDIKLKFVN